MTWCILWNCHQMNITGSYWWQVNIRSGNGFVPSGHYLSQCWPRSMSPYGVTRPQWVKRHDCIHSFVPKIYCQKEPLPSGAFLAKKSPTLGEHSVIETCNPIISVMALPTQFQQPLPLASLRNRKHIGGAPTNEMKPVGHPLGPWSGLGAGVEVAVARY